jgi:hypothetical protein
MKKHFINLSLVLLSVLLLGTFLKIHSLSQRIEDMDSRFNKLTKQLETKGNQDKIAEKTTERISKYGAKVMLIGGTGSRQLQKEAYNLEDQEYLSPEEEWVPTILNRPADLLRVSCRDGFRQTSCEGGREEEFGNEIFCTRSVNKEMQNVITIECSK